ncbi:hypothetical protein HMPREF0992_00161 [Lachnospiraceae bacterium 6_1_63FAA]|nr:hypothetical protein HMPREF0992_00161 [Lachnospiraceae bacterium 6_1_63FAA]
MNVLEKILEEIEKEQNSYEAEHAWNYSKGLEYAKEIIHSHMDDVTDTNVGSKNNWIPCSEGLPNEIEFQEAYCRNQYAAEFLVTIKGATRPTTLYFRNNSWFDEGRNYYKVVAWQPLPAPYKGEEAAG